ncbi:MAG: queuine tRNA-ribosyltransferase containing PUA domain protein [Thermoplasmata archaeon]|nr:queuine tRNA-ribosyltransferase containing PUA domain protein [Thermoplasmata archaeon]
MLDVNYRSFRGRVCEYRDGDISITTPAVIRTVSGPCDDGIHILVENGTRFYVNNGIRYPLDVSQIKSTSFGLYKGDVTMCGEKVAAVRLPLPDKMELPETVEMVLLTNAYDLRNNARALVDVVIKLREAIGYNVVLGFLGIAEPSTLALLAYMGVDVFDDSLCKVLGSRGVRTIPEGLIQASGDVSDINVSELLNECAKVSDFIKGGRLRELVDQRSSSSPISVAALRVFDRVGYEYQEESVNNSGSRFSCNTTQSLRRPDVLRYRNTLMERYVKPKHKRVLLLLPCSAKKPYHTSKTHKRFSFSIHASNFDTVVHEVIVTSPLGIVPRELDCFYPANSYDIPVTGEWKCQEKQFIRDMLAHLLEQGYDKVISHLGEDTELIEGLCDDIVETVVGDSVSPASLNNLETALREATEGMKVGDYAEDRKETIRSVLCFQFGKEVADRIMDENTFGTGRFPYWKIQRNKVQLAMMSEERGAFSLTVDGGKVVAECGKNIVNMMDFELKGNLFAIGVIDADPGIRIGDETVVMKNGEVVAVGVATMSGREMTELKRGIAVKIRHKAKK